MSDNWAESGVVSRYRAVVVATLRVRQLRRGAKPRLDLDDRKHKDTFIAIEEVRRGLITCTPPSLPSVVTEAIADLKGFEEPVLVGSTGGFRY